MATRAKKSASKTSSKKKTGKKKTSTKKSTAKKVTIKKTSRKKTATSKTSKKKPSASKKTKGSMPGTISISREERWRMIATTAYLKAEARNFSPGHEMEDWLAAEREVDALIGGKNRNK